MFAFSKRDREYTATLDIEPLREVSLSLAQAYVHAQIEKCAARLSSPS